jgi:hypothetical protein
MARIRGSQPARAPGRKSLPQGEPCRRDIACQVTAYRISHTDVTQHTVWLYYLASSVLIAKGADIKQGSKVSQPRWRHAPPGLIAGCHAERWGGRRRRRTGHQVARVGHMCPVTRTNPRGSAAHGNSTCAASTPRPPTPVYRSGTDGEPVVALRPLCDALGIDYSNQLKKLRSRSWATVLRCRRRGHVRAQEIRPRLGTNLGTRPHRTVQNRCDTVQSMGYQHPIDLRF